MKKAALRKEYLEKRQALTHEEYARLNEHVLQYLMELNWEGIHYLHCFWPIKEKHEVDVLSIIPWLKNKYPAIKIVLPQADFETDTLHHRLYDGTPLEKNK